MDQGTSQNSTRGGDAADLSCTPRQLTPYVRRRAWQDPNVRYLWLVAIAVFIAAVYMTTSEWHRWYEEGRLIREGDLVEAVAWETGGAKAANRPIKQGMMIDLTYTINGQEIKTNGFLADDNLAYYTGKAFKVRVNKSDPKEWTNRMQPVDLAGRLWGLYVAMPAALIVFFSAWLRWAGILRLWQDGVLVNVVVDGHTQSAMAPRSTLVSCHNPMSRQAELIRVFVQPPAEAPAVGSTLQLICDSVNPRRCIPVATYLG